MIEHNWLLPQGLPFSVLEHEHIYQVQTYFNLLYSAKTFDTFYKTAVYLRDNINEYIFVYVTTVAIYHRADTQGIIVPPLYEIFPSFFNNAEIMTTAQRITTHGKHWVEHYPSTYVWDNNVVVRWNSSVWPYYSKEMPVSYFTHDYVLNNYYYNIHALYPPWLGNEVVPLIKDHRGEWFWFIHKQILARYYMERLSNGLGEIPELGLDIVKQGYSSGLAYHNGIPYPVRPNYLYLQQPWLVHKIDQIVDYERRMYDVIDSGLYVTPAGKYVNVHHPEAIDVIGRLIEANVDSPNKKYYKDFISVWKNLLGNSNVHEPIYWKGIPLVLPSALEHYQTALRDPAFYMIWKRVLHMFTLWQEKLPYYTKEDLYFPGVKVDNVVVDKLVTYFDDYLMDITNAVILTEDELKKTTSDMKLFVRKRRLNHQPFKVTRSMFSLTKAADCVVRFFLAPKYDNVGRLIDINMNRLNFVELDSFLYKLTTGQNVIIRNSYDMHNLVRDRVMTRDLWKKVDTVTDFRDLLVKDLRNYHTGFPTRPLLPKGIVGGMKMMLYVIVTPLKLVDNVELNILDTNRKDFVKDFRSTVLLDKRPLGFPFDRRIDVVKFFTPNMKFVDVIVFHKKQVCDMKTRWNRYVLKNYYMVDKTYIDNTFFVDADIHMKNVVDRVDQVDVNVFDSY
uniref:Storage protein 2 n=1 Tax=Omphisa fuscidentalis TaxID=386629 RepID=A4GTP2_9NEOP|nr:storage protein 2 [Omphisa fuscidentalis]